jgi:hypothetical protein
MTWRSDCDALIYERIEVPDAVTNGVGRFLDALGLNYGASRSPPRWRTCSRKDRPNDRLAAVRRRIDGGADP